MSDIDFSRLRPLVCGAAHRAVWGSTGFEDPKHWCNLALGEAQAAPAPAQPAPVTPPPTAGGYRMTDWSGWARFEGVEYRYRVGWDPARGGKTVDAIFEVRNVAGRTWSGSARTATCQGTLGGSADVSLAPGQSREVRFRADNCGNANNPFISHPSVATARTF
jgi:hypothetical protein